MANLEPRDKVGRIYEGDTKHCYTQNIKALGLIVSEKKSFKCVPHYNPMGAIRRHGNQNSNPIWPKTYCNLSPTPMIVQIKFGFDWPRGSEKMFEHCGRRTDAGPWVYYKLTL